MDTATFVWFFRLKDAPWFLLVGSAFALLTIAAWFFELGAPSESVRWLVGTAGIPVQGVITTVHQWFAAPSRNTIVVGVLWAALALVVVGYVHSAFCINQARAGVRDKREYWNGRRAALVDTGDRHLPVSEADRKEMLARAEKDLDAEITYSLKVRSYYLGRIYRLASAAWIGIALTFEAGGFTWPWLLVLGVGGVGGLFVGIATAGLDESFVERLKGTGEYVIVAAISWARTAVSLVLFLVGLVISQPVSRGVDEGPGPAEA